MNNINKLISLLSHEERKKGLIIILFSLLTSAFDAISATSLMPFISLLSKSNESADNKLLSLIRDLFGFQNETFFISFIGCLVFITLLLSLFLKTITFYLQVRFSLLREYSISKRLINLYLNQNYEWFLNEDSSNLGKSILSEVTEVVRGGIIPLMNLISALTLSIFMIIVLIVLDFKLAITMGISFLGFYLLIYKTIKNTLVNIGEDKFKANEDRYFYTKQVFENIKEVKLNSLEKNYIKKFSTPALVFARNHSTSKLIGQLPRFLLELLAFGSIILLSLYALNTYDSLNNFLPLFAVYIYAAYRLIPSLQQIYSSFTQLKFSSESVKRLYYDFKNLNNVDNFEGQKGILYPIQKIQLNEINYKFSNCDEYIIQNLNLEIEANTINCIVGSSGSGKSTLINILLGLFIPLSGKIKIDNQILNPLNIKSWQRSIGYVPQNLLLINDSLASNIAFGEDKQKINYQRLKEVCETCCINEFIMNELPDGYETYVGEKGLKLSGGQAQRIGIARALYKNPKVLILDEATNALDNITEKKIISNLQFLKKDLTIILITHRLSSIKDSSDKIIFLDNGYIVAEGSYEELLNKNILFSNLVLKKEKRQ